MRIVAIVQARMGSSRLPGKIFLPLAGKPVLLRVIERLRRSAALDEVVVATTVRDIDDPVERACADWATPVVRGDEDDVLSRYALAAEAAGADAVMRITADCPLIDPDVVAAMVAAFRADRDIDFITNSRLRTFPRGLDAELFTRDSLATMVAEARTQAQREHVTPFLYVHPERFCIVDHVRECDVSDLRLTLDTNEDYALLNKIYDAVPDADDLSLDDVLALLDANPSWIAMNAHIEQKSH